VVEYWSIESTKPEVANQYHLAQITSGPFLVIGYGGCALRTVGIWDFSRGATCISSQIEAFKNGLELLPWVRLSDEDAARDVRML